MLRQLPTTHDRHVLIDAGSFSDAGVYRIGPNRALVQTADFFTPIVDDPFAYGQIAAANALSDVYAMGARPITALNLLAVPVDRVPADAIRQILRGGASKVKEAGCALLGGHTIKNPEPIYGLSVTGIVDPRKMLTNARARPGDLLVLTKPLGTGIATTAIKRGLASAALARRVTIIMRQLNRVGAELAERGLVKAATDITGFGLLGHLVNVCRASRVGATLVASDVPVISPEIWRLIERDCIPGGSHANRESANESVVWNDATDAQKFLLSDAQTSGGLLLCVAPRNWSEVERRLQRHRTFSAAVIGRVTKGRARVSIE
ncbi:selenide, water dikinase SelD [soil metagenome]